MAAEVGKCLSPTWDSKQQRQHGPTFAVREGLAPGSRPRAVDESVPDQGITRVAAVGHSGSGGKGVRGVAVEPPVGDAWRLQTLHSWKVRGRQTPGC